MDELHRIEELSETDAATFLADIVEDKFRASPFKVGESERCKWVSQEVQSLLEYYNDYGNMTDDFVMEQIAVLYRFACTTEDATQTDLVDERHDDGRVVAGERCSGCGMNKKSLCTQDDKDGFLRCGNEYCPRFAH